MQAGGEPAPFVRATRRVAAAVSPGIFPRQKADPLGRSGELEPVRGPDLFDVRLLAWASTGQNDPSRTLS